MAVVLLVAWAGCGKGKGRKGHGGKKKGKRVFTVHLKKVAGRVLTNDIVASGTTRPVREMYISTQVGGSITLLNVALGHKVKKGELLARVSTVGLWGESQQVVADLKRLKADLAQAKQELKDTDKLYKQKIVSRQNYDDARYKLLRLQAQQAQAHARLGSVGERYRGGTVRAPFDGVIAAQNAELGDFAPPGKVIGHLVDMSSIKVSVSLAEVDMVRLDRKMPVTVTFAALGKRVWKGSVLAVAPTADKQTGAFPVEILIDNSDGALRGGMAARAAFHGPGIAGLFVPVESVVQRGGKMVAYVLPPNAEKVELRVCRLGMTRDGLVQVLSGLATGDRLVVSGNTRLRQGSKVKVAGAAAHSTMKSTSGPTASSSKK